LFLNTDLNKSIPYVAFEPVLSAEIKPSHLILVINRVLVVVNEKEGVYVIGLIDYLIYRFEYLLLFLGFLTFFKAGYINNINALWLIPLFLKRRTLNPLTFKMVHISHIILIIILNSKGISESIVEINAY